MKTFLISLCLVTLVSACHSRSLNESRTTEIVDSSGQPNQPLTIKTTSCESRVTAFDTLLNSEKSFTAIGADSRGYQALFFVNGSCSVYGNLSDAFSEQSYVGSRTVAKINGITFTAKGKYQSRFIEALRLNTADSIVGAGRLDIWGNLSPCIGAYSSYCDIVITDGKFAAPYVSIKKQLKPEDFNEK